MYAVLETGGKQYRVAAGDTLEIELLPVTAGQVHTFDRVLLINKEGNVTVGNPVIAGATIKADVVSHIRGDKVVAFKMRRRKGYHKKIGQERSRQFTQRARQRQQASRRQGIRLRVRHRGKHLGPPARFQVLRRFQRRHRPRLDPVRPH